MICAFVCLSLNTFCDIFYTSLFSSGSPQAFSMLGNSYPTAGGLSQNHVQAMNGLSSNDISPFDIHNDFPQLTSRPSSAAGQGQLGK